MRRNSARLQGTLLAAIAVGGMGCLETAPPNEERAGGLAVAVEDTADVGGDAELGDFEATCVRDADCVGRPRTECSGLSCSCAQRGGTCGPIVHQWIPPHYYWLYSDETECLDPDVCNFESWPTCSGNVGEHVRVGPNSGYLELVRPARPALGLLGCEGKEVFFAQGSCAGPHSQSVTLRARRDRWGDTYPIWYDEPWRRSGSCPAACPQQGVWVACIDKNGDGDYADPGEQSDPIQL